MGDYRVALQPRHLRDPISMAIRPTFKLFDGWKSWGLLTRSLPLYLRNICSNFCSRLALCWDEWGERKEEGRAGASQTVAMPPAPADIRRNRSYSATYSASSSRIEAIPASWPSICARKLPRSFRTCSKWQSQPASWLLWWHFGELRFQSWHVTFRRFQPVLEDRTFLELLLRSFRTLSSMLAERRNDSASTVTAWNLAPCSAPSCWRSAIFFNGARRFRQPPENVMTDYVETSSLYHIIVWGPVSNSLPIVPPNFLARMSSFEEKNSLPPMLYCPLRTFGICDSALRTPPQID